MPIEKCNLNISVDHRELKPHGTPDFPCAGYSDRYEGVPVDAISWHYHEELEVCYIKKGQLKFQVPDKIYHLKEGDGIFFNSNVLHYALAEPFCELQSFVFHPLLISGHKDSLIEQKYILPLINCNSINAIPLRAANNEERKMSAEITHAFDALSSDVPGFEFTVRESLSNICFWVFLQNKHRLISQKPDLNQSQFRIRTMLNFIHEQYTETLTISQIAESAKIGEREALRCFHRMIQCSPLQYLLKYRIRKGASMLLSQKSLNIAEISLHCGFNSPSNFAQTFKKYYNCSPREYRQQNLIS